MYNTEKWLFSVTNTNPIREVISIFSSTIYAKKSYKNKLLQFNQRNTGYDKW